MESDTVEFWNEIWSTMDHTFADYDELLVEHAGELQPGRALELGCGSGGNAVWMAKRGWRVTALDFSDVAIEKARMRAAERGVEVEFLVSDVTTYQSDEQYDLIASFYIQLWPEERAQMLAMAARSLAPGGTLLFVSHDKSSPPSGWSDDDLASLTSPGEVAAELPGLIIERVETVEGGGAHMADPSDHDYEHQDYPGEHTQQEEDHSHSATTVIVAVRPR